MALSCPRRRPRRVAAVGSFFAWDRRSTTARRSISRSRACSAPPPDDARGCAPTCERRRVGLEVAPRAHPARRAGRQPRAAAPRARGSSSNGARRRAAAAPASSAPRRCRRTPPAPRPFDGESTPRAHALRRGRCAASGRRCAPRCERARGRGCASSGPCTEADPAALARCQRSDARTRYSGRLGGLMKSTFACALLLALALARRATTSPPPPPPPPPPRRRPPAPPPRLATEAYLAQQSSLAASSVVAASPLVSCDRSARAPCRRPPREPQQPPLSPRA